MSSELGGFGIRKGGAGGGGTGLYVRLDGTTPLTGDWNAGAYKITANSFTSTLDSTFNTLTVGKGGSSVSTNTAVGYNSLFANTTGTNNTALGYGSLQSNTTGTANTALGSNSLLFNTTGQENTAIGNYSLRVNTTGNGSTAVGNYSLRSNTTGYYNTAIGWQSLQANTTGQENTALGYNSLSSNTSGYDNVAIGIGSLSNNGTAFQNTAIGSYTLVANSSGSNNVAVGFNSLYNNTTGTTNTSLGAYSAEHNTVGTNNLYLGYAAGRHLADGTTTNTGSINSIYVGANTKAKTTTDTNQVVIGYNAIGNGSNTVTIGNTSITDTYLRGAVTFNGAFKFPSTDGTSSQVLQTNGSGVISWATVAGGLTYFTEAQNSSAPNATVNVDSLTAIASTTNADISIVPKGNGAFQLAIPDNTATGGNKRGTYAVDLQRFRTANTQVASGDYSSVLGGYGNTASNNYAIAGGYLCVASNNWTVALGASCTASNSNSIALGYRAKATGDSSICLASYFYSDSTASSQNSIVIGFGVSNANFASGFGQNVLASGAYSTAIGYSPNTFGTFNRIALSGGIFTSQGDSQKSIIRLAKRTTDATLTTLTCDNSNLVAQGTQLYPQFQQMIRYKGTITGKQSGSTNVGVWDIDGVVVKGSTQASITLTVNNINLVTNASGWGTPTVSVDTTNGWLQIQVQGLVGTNIQWLCILDTVDNLYL